MKNVVFFMIKSAENTDSQSYDRHEESRNFWRCNFTKACCNFTKNKKIARIQGCTGDFLILGYLHIPHCRFRCVSALQHWLMLEELRT